jgi:DNA-binding NarL/FixJ family response regulator
VSADRFAELSPRQVDVLRLVAEGLPDPEIAVRLGLTESTTRTHVRRVLDKLGARNRAQAAYLLGYRLGRRA